MCAANKTHRSFATLRMTRRLTLQSCELMLQSCETEDWEEGD